MGNARLYRLENGQGLGPYNASFRQTEAVDGFLNDRRKHLAHQPSVRYDVVGFKPGMLSSFKSLSQFKKWFDEPHVLEDLYKAGFSLVVYTVAKENVRYGKKQTGFYFEDVIKRTVIRQGANPIPVDVDEDEDVFFSTKQPLFKTAEQKVNDVVKMMQSVEGGRFTTEKLKEAAAEFVKLMGGWR
jgi:hypothetical protein